jgi:hypothetical protein
LLETLSDVEEEKEVIDYANLHISSDCTKCKSIMLEVLRYMDFANRLVLGLEAQKGFARNVNDDV